MPSSLRLRLVRVYVLLAAAKIIIGEILSWIAGTYSNFTTLSGLLVLSSTALAARIVWQFLRIIGKQIETRELERQT
jgi:hypothetical protein